MQEEALDILDSFGNLTGAKAAKKEIHQEGLWHQTVHVWIYNSRGEVLLQKRAKTKNSWPCLWDISAAGHIDAGEAPLRAALRELYEELGIRAKAEEFKPLRIVKSIKHIPQKDYHDYEFEHVYLLKFDGKISDLKLENEEIEEVKFLPLGRFEEEIRDVKIKKTYTPHKKNYFLMVIKEIKKITGKK